MDSTRSDRPPTSEQQATMQAELGLELYNRIVDTFWAKLPQLMQDATDGMTEGRLADARIAVHSIKGSAENLGLTLVAHAADAAEAQLRDGRHADLTPLNEALALYRTVEEVL